VPQIEPVKFPSDHFPPKTPIDKASDIRLESGGEVTAWSQWTYHLGPPLLLLRCDADNHVTRLYSAGAVMQEWYDPLEALRFMEQFRRETPIPGPPFKGGWVGYLSYDFGRLFERIPTIAKDDLHLPLFQFTYHDQLWALDRVTNENVRIFTPRWDPVNAVVLRDSIGMELNARLTSTFRRSEYERAVKRAMDYIAAGDIFQVNLSQRFTAPIREPAHQVFLKLQKKNPGWFGAYLGLGNHAIVSNSPELFLRVTPKEDGSRTVVTRPIKGTRPRSDGMDAALRDSPKDAAELNMIIDLERNDLGRVCETGSVRVSEPRTIEAHPTVYHGVATVEGALRREVDLVDLLRATFPGGSITGAPKIRAMQIIEELEPVRRGPYCGAIGFISVDGHIEFNIAIRTMVFAQGLVHISVGGGIVADSSPADEYDETLVKAQAMCEAVGIDLADLKMLR
jgi:para-aminobenzoate synthetase component 1